MKEGVPVRQLPVSPSPAVERGCAGSAFNALVVGGCVAVFAGVFYKIATSTSPTPVYDKPRAVAPVEPKSEGVIEQEAGDAFETTRKLNPDAEVIEGAAQNAAQE